MRGLLVLVVLIGLTACGQARRSTEVNGDQDQKIADLNARLDKANADNNVLNTKLGQIDSRLSSNEDKVRALEDAGMAVNELIDPCGDAVGQFDEVLIRLSSGQIVAFFEGTNNTRFLSVLGDGQYQTSDEQKCRFDVVNGQIVLK
jgi:hypothetical protein